MPYIAPERRPLFDESIKAIIPQLGLVLECNHPMESTDDNLAKGDLNYIIYCIVRAYIQKNGLRYHRINDFICGTLTACQLELYRRIGEPYEDKAIEKNGDVTIESLLELSTKE